MKNKIRCIFSAAAATTICLALLSPGFLHGATQKPAKKAQTEQAPAASDSQKDSDPVAAFQNSRYWKKLDERTQQAWLDAMGANDPERRMDCFVRVRWPADQGDESFLISKGFDVRFFSGTIASGHMKANDMPDVAALPFVDSVKLSTPSDKK